MSKVSFTIGTDPEFFIQDAKGNLLKASEFTKGTKDDLQEIEHGYSCHADNVMLELNIPAAVSKAGFVDNINTGKALLLEKVIPGNSLLIKPSVDFPELLLTEDKDFESGCEPDMNAYTLEENPPVNLSLSNKRYAGGHIHVGLKEVPGISEIADMVQALDFCFMPFIIKNDLDAERKKIYGTAGRFREKPYGFEYRPLSNFWLANDKFIKRAYDIVEYALNNYEYIVKDSYRMDLVEQQFQNTIDIEASEMDVNMISEEIPELTYA